MDNQKIIDEARRLVDGDDVPLWAVAAALQLGYTGSIVFRVVQIILKWHDLHGNDQELALAERAARAMQEECYITIPSAYGILRDAVHALDACAVARRALDAAVPEPPQAESAHDKMLDALNEMAADRARYIPPAPDESDELWAGV